MCQSKRFRLLLVAIWFVLLCVTPMMTDSSMAVDVPVVRAETVYDKGDINADGRVNMIDAQRLYFYVSGGDVVMTVAQLKRADMTDEGDVNMVDAVRLYAVAAGRELNTSAVTPITSTTITTTTTTTTTTGSSTTATTTPTAVRGIDVSYAQGEVDWAAVKSDNVKFAVLRCGYGQDQTDQDDSRFDEYAAACEQYDIPYGAYLFCYARNATEAAGEAQHALRLLEGKNLTLPIFLDMEDSSWQGNLSPSTCAEIATVFCETLSEAGYKVGVYANLYWWNEKLTDDCFDQWYRWVAQYNTTCDYEGTFHMWQYSETGSVDGIDSKVDMNYCYLDPTAF